MNHDVRQVLATVYFVEVSHPFIENAIHYPEGEK